jgi:hypothetical protein
MLYASPIPVYIALESWWIASSSLFYLFTSLTLKLASDQRDIVVLEDNHDILCDTPHNIIIIKRGLAPEVKVSKPPADWAPDQLKVECAGPESFVGWLYFPLRRVTLSCKYPMTNTYQLSFKAKKAVSRSEPLPMATIFMLQNIR